jgi:Plant ATP synthase F0
MPQLDQVSFLSQFVWLCVLYLGFYYTALKVFLPKLGRIVAVRKRKITLSPAVGGGRDSEGGRVRTHRDGVLAQACGVSRDVFQGLVAQTTHWVEASTLAANQDVYRHANTRYLESLGATSLSQALAVYHAGHRVPPRLGLVQVVDQLRAAAPRGRQA